MLFGCVTQNEITLCIKLNLKHLNQLWISFGMSNGFKSPISQASLSRMLVNSNAESLFLKYYELTQEKLGGLPHETNHICVDGKARKGVGVTTSGRCEMDLSAYDPKKHLTLFSKVITTKQSESNNLEGMIINLRYQKSHMIISADAGLTSSTNTKVLVQNGCGYVLALKGNAGHIYKEIQLFNWTNERIGWAATETKHGRTTTRELKQVSLRKFDLPLREQLEQKYQDLQSLVCIHTKTIKKEKEFQDTRYFLVSKALRGYSEKKIASIIREHWGIENKLHWTKGKRLI